MPGLFAAANKHYENLPFDEVIIMTNKFHGTALFALAASILLLAFGSVSAQETENIDPLNDGSQYAWGENVGWFNFEPFFGPGVAVDDYAVTGYVWAENIGWINLSPTEYGGVANDGCGNLSGYGWGENVGWVNFSPTSGGVTIDPTSGDFSGAAWGENVGWITFASTGPYPYMVKTSWTVAAPSGAPTLSAYKSGPYVSLSWTPVASASGYDVVSGDLAVLRTSSGDFSAATQTCEASNHGSPSLSVSGTLNPGEGDWFLVRGQNCGGSGTYGTMQRDAEISASGNDCQ
jgi:hypothetical protein